MTDEPTMTPADLEACRLSAEALGYVVHGECWQDNKFQYLDIGPVTVVPWNPLTDAEQRWECVEWLLARGWYDINFCGDGEHHLWSLDKTYGSIFQFDGPAAEFPARAVAELRRREEKA